MKRRRWLRLGAMLALTSVAVVAFVIGPVSTAIGFFSEVLVSTSMFSRQPLSSPAVPRLACRLRSSAPAIRQRWTYMSLSEREALSPRASPSRR